MRSALALRRVEVRRYRAFATMVALSLATSYAMAPWIAGDPTLHAVHLIASAPSLVYLVYFLWATRELGRYQTWMGELLGYVCLFDVMMTYPYFGPLSFVALFSAVGIFVYAQCESKRMANILAVGVVGGSILLSFLGPALGWEDRSFIGLYDAAPERGYAVAALVTLIYVLAYAQARLVRASTLGSIEELDGAAAMVGTREAMLAEAQSEIQRALRGDRKGRFTGRTLGGYALGELLGRGANGEVYEATRGDERLALKMLQLSAARDAAKVEAFLREVRSVAALHDEHLVRVVDHSPAGAAIPYLVMERLQGASLSDHLRTRGRLSVEEALEMVGQVARGLQVAHAHGVVHCDIKPANLFGHQEVGGPLVWKVLDFGASCFGEQRAEVVDGRLVGTPAYMAPEQIGAGRIDGRADLYSLGVVLYRSIVGRPAFGGATAAQILHAIGQRMPSAPQAFGISDDVADVLAIALAKDPRDRFEDILELAVALEHAVAGRLPRLLRDHARGLLEKHPWQSELSLWMDRAESLGTVAEGLHAATAVAGGASLGGMGSTEEPTPTASLAGVSDIDDPTPTASLAGVSDIDDPTPTASLADANTTERAEWEDTRLDDAGDSRAGSGRRSVCPPPFSTPQGVSGPRFPTSPSTVLTAPSRGTVKTTLEGGRTMQQALLRNELRNLRLFAKLILVVLSASVPVALFLGGPVWVLGAHLALGAACAIYFAAFVAWTRDPRRYRPAHGVAFAALFGLSVASGLGYWGTTSAIMLFVPFGLCVFAQGATRAMGVVFYGFCQSASLAWGFLALLGVTEDLGLGGVLADDALSKWATFAGVQVLLVLSLWLAHRQREGTEITFRELDLAARELAGRQALLDEFRAELEKSVQVGGPGPFSGHTFGSHRLGVLLGRGGMGDVYEAVHLQSGEPAAVKLMNSRVTHDAGIVRRFLRETRMVAALRTPHIVRILELPDAESPVPFIAMERLVGQTLSQRLREGQPLEPDEAITLVREVGAGIAAAHEAGIVHRDLKPANLFQHRDADSTLSWKILDFGVSKSLDVDATQTGGGFLGTPGYMAPEQVRGQPVDARSDLYAFGTVLYRALTGRPPFRGAASEVLRQVLADAPPPVSRYRPELPAAIDAVLARALAKAPEARFEDVDAFVQAAEAALRAPRGSVTRR